MSLRDVLLQVAQVLTVLALAPLIQGVILQFEERVQRAQGPGAGAEHGAAEVQGAGHRPGRCGDGEQLRIVRPHDAAGTRLQTYVFGGLLPEELGRKLGEVIAPVEPGVRAFGFLVHDVESMLLEHRYRSA